MNIKKVFQYVLVLFVAFMAYYLYQNNAGLITESGIGVEEINQNEDIGRKTIELLNKINSLTLEDDIFENVEFKSLQTITVNIPDQPVGRVNPFSPIK